MCQGSKKNLLFLANNLQLKAMVRNFTGHFTCALSENDTEKLEYLDDLCENSYYFSNKLNDLILNLTPENMIQHSRIE